MKSKEQLIKDVVSEGYKDVRVCPLPPSIDTPEHTHDVHTVHIILDGELIITKKGKTHHYKPGDRVEFKAGTTHKAKSKEGGSMIIGVKK